MTGSLLFDQSLNGLTGTMTGTDIAPTYPGFLFNGTDDFVDIGTGPDAVKTVALWVDPNDVGGNDYPIDLNGTDFLSIETGTLTNNGFGGIGARFLYVDGVKSATAVTASWHLIGVTKAGGGKNAIDFDIGKETANFFTGTIGEVWLYNDVLTPDEMKNLYETTKWRYQK